MESSAQVAALELLVAWSSKECCAWMAVLGDTVSRSSACEKDDDVFARPQGRVGKAREFAAVSRPGRRYEKRPRRLWSPARPRCYDRAKAPARGWAGHLGS